MIQAILARSTDRIVGTMGKDGPCLPWRLPPDLKRFKALTSGHAIIMGRTTFESIGKALPNRHNIVVSTLPPSEWDAEVKHGDPVEWAGDPAQAVEMALVKDPHPFVIGGAQIYAELWDRIELVRLTTVHMNVGLGLVFEWDPMVWTEGVDEDAGGDFEGLKYTFSTLMRRPPPESNTEEGDAKR